MNSNIYKQYDSRWGALPYPTKAYSFSGNGCGCCACLHVIIEQEAYKKWTPKELRPYMVNQGFATRGNGTTWSGIKLTLEHYGNKVINHATMSDIFKTLNTRKKNKQPCLGVILFKGGSKGGITWTSGGHYVAFVDYKVDGNKHYFYTKDSGGRNHDGWYCYETQMKGLIPQIWSALPTDKKKVEPSKEKEEKINTDKLAVDGIAGKTTIMAAQKFFGTPQTGEFGGQLKSLKKYHKGFAGNIEYGKGGSAFIYALQRYLKLSNPDGQLGPNTIKATQKMIGVTADGYWGTATSKAFQKWLNTKINGEEKANSSKKTLLGIDISVWQKKVSKANFIKAKNAGIKFVILRLGYTGSESKKPTLDSVFENNYKNAVAAGLDVGVYYYSLATSNDMAKKEAEFCINHLSGKTLNYPVYIDVEDPKYQAKKSKATLASVCNTFCNIIKNAGYRPGVYASTSWFNSKIGNITAAHTKWVAQYYKKCEYKGSYDMWQYTSSGKVNGFKGNIDMNYYYVK